MHVRDTDFGPVWGGSGVGGFFGEGYWFHPLLLRLGLLDTTGVTFVAKTVTVDPVSGNLPLDPYTWQPREYVPRCIHLHPLDGSALNGVGLSNFGIKAALATGRWQQRTEPFMLSFAPVRKTRAEREAEATEFVKILRPALAKFQAPVALQVNVSCVNSGFHTSADIGEIIELPYILIQLGIPLVVKLGVQYPPEDVQTITNESLYDAVVMSNTVAFETHFPAKTWQRWYPQGSPLAHLGGGGLSGRRLFPAVRQWFADAEHYRFRVPFCWSGGIMSPEQVRVAFASRHVTAVSLASIVMLRPHQVAATIAAAPPLIHSATTRRRAA